MKKIKLTQGKYALVDNSNFDYLNQFSWNYHEGYATRGYRIGLRKFNKVKMVRMHNEIMNPLEGLEIDHINGDGLDNRRSNLRIATHKQNSHNRKIPRNNTSGHIGVSFDKKMNKWRTQITINRKVTHLGFFDDLSLAAKTYLKAAKEYYGEFIRIKND